MGFSCLVTCQNKTTEPQEAYRYYQCGNHAHDLL
jgi:hypothetical protein